MRYTILRVISDDGRNMVYDMTQNEGKESGLHVNIILHKNEDIQFLR